MFQHEFVCTKGTCSLIDTPEVAVLQITFPFMFPFLSLKIFQIVRDFLNLLCLPSSLHLITVTHLLFILVIFITDLWLLQLVLLF